MKNISMLISIFLFFSAHAIAQTSRIDTFEKEIKVGSDSIHISIRSAPVEKSDVSISDIDTCRELPCLGGFPSHLTEHIGQFDILWNEKPIHIEKSLYEDCFTPVLSEMAGMWDSLDNGGVLAIPGKDGKSVLIMMKAYRSACCGYTVWWSIDKNGYQKRFIDDSIP